MEVPRVLMIAAGDIAPVNSLVYPNGRKTHTLWKLERTLPHVGEFDFIMPSCGLAEKAEIQTVPAAEIMEEWLKDWGVPAEKIILESRSVDSAENLIFSWEGLKRRGIHIDRLYVATHWLHGLRFLLIGRARKIPVRLLWMHYPMPLKDWIRYGVYLLYQFFYDWGSSKPFAERLREGRRRRAAPIPSYT